MNTDAFFTMGKQHTVCQDYALAAPGTVVLSDGCSSSPHTDFGSRLLCRMASIHGCGFAAEKARPFLDPLGLPSESLDATLLMARWVPATASTLVSIHGDGMVIGRRRDGTYTSILVSYPSGAPLYPNYDIDPARKERYAKEFGTTRTVIYEGYQEPSVVDTELLHEGTWREASTLYEFYASIFDLVIILSDGALSFRRPLGNKGITEAVPVEEIVAEMLAVKGYAGEFITRRAKRFLKDATAKGWHHDDDFTVAALYMGDTP